MDRLYRLSVVVLLFSAALFWRCSKDYISVPASEQRDELKPRGSISGYVYDKNGHPLEDVVVDVDSGKGTPDVSDADGYFKVEEVVDSCILRFVRRDYDDAPRKVTIRTGRDTVLADTVNLGYSWFIIKGAVKGAGGAVTGAGVAVAGNTESTLSGTAGTFLLNRVPKNSDVVLLCSKGGEGTAVKTLKDMKNDDTTDIGEIILDDEGAAVSGIVYDKDRHPISGATVSVIGGAGSVVTDEFGFYRIEDVPAGTDGVIISVSYNGAEGMVSGISAQDGAYITGCDIVAAEPQDLKYGMRIGTNDYFIDESDTETVLSVFPELDVSTRIEKFEWEIGGQVVTTTVPYCTINPSVFGENTSVTVVATNTEGETVESRAFGILKKEGKPVIDSIGVSADGATFDRSVTVNKDDWVLFYVNVSDLFGGLKELSWNFGDSTEWVSDDSNPSVSHLYASTGEYTACFTAVDFDDNSVRDSVRVVVKKPPLEKPSLVWPDSVGDVVLAGDSLTLQWKAVADSGVVYNVYLDGSNSIPSEKSIVCEGVREVVATVKARNNTRYFWRIKAIRKSDSASVWSSIWNFRAVTGKTAVAPKFVSTPGHMNDTMLVSREYRDTLRATDANGDHLTFSFVDSIAGMKITDSILVFTPLRTDNGSRSVKVYTTDPTGLKDSLLWTIYINILPQLAQPDYLSPSDKAVSNTIVDSVTLRWGAAADTGVVYDVYWDTRNPPENVVKKGMKETSITVGVDSGVVYYWRVKATRLFDGAVAQGPVWQYSGRSFGEKSGLIAEWTFEGSANDMTGHGYDANLTDGEYVAGRYGSGSQAFRSFGTSSAEIENSRGADDSVVSITFWVRLESSSGTFNLILPDGSFSTSIANNYLDLWKGSFISEVDISYEEWSYVVLVNANEYVYEYINGKEVKRPSIGNTILSTLGKITIQLYNGCCIDDIRFYNRSLSAEEVKNTFENWKKQNHPPFFGTIPAPDTLIVGRVYDQVLPATDIDGDLLRYSLHAAPGITNLRSNAVRCIPEFTSIGTRNFQAAVSDGRGGKDTLLWQKVIVNTSFADSLVAYYPFNVNGKDFSGNGFDASVWDLWYPDRFGRDSLAEYISNGNSIGVIGAASFLQKYYSSGSTTFSAWVQAHSATDCGVFTSIYDALSISAEGKLLFKGKWLVKDATTADSIKEITLNGSTIFPEAWNHIAAVVTADSVVLYVNGEEAGKCGIPDGLVKNMPAGIRIGLGEQFSIGGYPYSVRLVNDVRLYNRALSAAEVKALFEFERP